MTHTDNDVVLATAIRDLIKSNKNTLGLDDVLYGNHNMIPGASAAVVHALGKTRDLIGVQGPGGRTDNSLNVGIDVHKSKVGDEETERRAVDELADQIEHLLHGDVTVGGIIIHGFVNNVQRGETTFFPNSQFRSVQMMFSGRTRTLIS